MRCAADGVTIKGPLGFGVVRWRKAIKIGSERLYEWESEREIFGRC